MVMTKEEKREKSRECSKKWREGHPGYNKIALKKHADKVLFGGHRKEVLERDNYTCQYPGCGMTNKQHLKKYKREITIHHKDCQGRYSDTPNNDMDNLITYCLSHHGKIDFKLAQERGEKPTKKVEVSE